MSFTSALIAAGVFVVLVIGFSFYLVDKTRKSTKEDDYEANN